MNDSQDISVGIASSIARDYNYSWTITIQYACQLNVNLVQLYLNPPRLIQCIHELSSINLDHLETILHLPDQSISATQLSEVLSIISNVSVIIQHENRLDEETIKLIQNTGKILGIENDNQLSPHNFLKTLKTLAAQNVNFIPVLDLPRFFHQYSNQYSINQIKRIIQDLIEFISELGKPIILHLIDSVEKSGDREDWRPLFEGDLPLSNLLRKIKSSVMINSIILEYESIKMTEQSLVNLRAYLNENSF